ncbi:MAG TPA: TMEM165/GDT1 family protein [Rhizomicrobium sp.]|jgi:putative Ca2+/H+ antiporter (TMEM165/GDT1 family)|nr:TMEM165/GDT1 family protein [Rhizomicrobium sp.]
METFLVSALVVALAEMGDRTQLLTIMLASRYRQPLAIIAGVFVATLLNHALAALAGYYIASVLNAFWFRYLIGASFIVMAAWILVPDKESKESEAPRRWGVMVATAIAFFIVEMGDKTQLATAALAARYHDVILVAAGTTTGMMIANIPAAFFGHAITRVVPLAWLRYVSAAIYVVLGLLSLAETAGYLR